MPTTCECCLRKRYDRGGFSLHGELYTEAWMACMRLRDFVTDYGPSFGRQAAVRAWQELRRQLAVLRRMFPGECP